MSKTRTIRREPSRVSKNAGSMILITIVLVMIAVIISFKNSELTEKKAAYEKEEAYLIEQIEKENARTEEIEEYRKYTKTKQYIEDMAREKLGLVKKDEIIFEADD